MPKIPTFLVNPGSIS